MQALVRLRSTALVASVLLCGIGGMRTGPGLEKLDGTVLDGSPVAGASPNSNLAIESTSAGDQAGDATSPQSWRYVSYYDREDKASSEIFSLLPEDGPTVAELVENLQPGQFVVRVDYISLLPLARAHLEKAEHIRDTGAEEIGLKRTKLRERAQGDQIATVVESKSTMMPKGAQMWLSPFLGLQSFRVMHDDGRDMVAAFGAPIPPVAFMLPPGIAPADYLAILTPGSGITAWMALNKGPMAEELNQKGWAGKKALVTSAAGGVGLVLVQLLLLKGCEVTGVTSTVRKAQRLKDETGVHHAVAYKELEDLDTELSKLGPFDIFIDNVGGWQLDAGIKQMGERGQIMMMGAISEHANYNMGKVRGIREYLDFPAKELTLRGFMLTNHMGENQANLDDAKGALKERILKKKVRPVVTLREGSFADFANELDGMLRGDGFGRVILKIIAAPEVVQKTTTDAKETEDEMLVDGAASARAPANDRFLSQSMESMRLEEGGYPQGSSLSPSGGSRPPQASIEDVLTEDALAAEDRLAVETFWGQRLGYYDDKNLDGYFADVADDIVLVWGTRTGKMGQTRTFEGMTAVRGFVSAMCGKYPYTHHLLNTDVKFLPSLQQFRVESEAKAAPAVAGAPLPTIYGTFTGYYAKRGGEWRLVKLINWFE